MTKKEEPYGKEQKAKELEKVRKWHKKAHKRAKQLLEEMGFKIEKDLAISNKPWDFIARKHGFTYYIDSKSPYSRKGSFTISVSEMRGMLELRSEGVPAYLFILPKGEAILFTARL